MQVILGGSGVIGRELARELRSKDLAVRVVSRRPKSLGIGESVASADLLDANAVAEATTLAKVVYLTAGLTYDRRIWRRDWPIIARNVLQACRKHGARLVYFDNIYMYGLVDGWLTETCPVRPSSEKGLIRAEISATFLKAADAGEVDVRIGRCGDFSGPTAENGFLNLVMIPKLRIGARPQWFGRADKKHSLTYTKDAARATAVLGLCDSLPGEQRVWLLPTDREAPTAQGWANLVAEALAVSAKPVQTLPRWLARVTWLRNRQLYEFVEMYYQYEHDYLISSEAFEKAFAMRPTPIRQWIGETVQS